MRKKQWEWGAQIRKHSVCAINAQIGTSLQIDPPPPSSYNVGNGNSRKFAQIHGKPYSRTIVALMQTTYEEEAVGMGSPKRQTFRLLNERTKRYELAN